MNQTSTQAICVLGMHRSGTSAVSAAISRLGVGWGRPEDLLSATADNPTGFFEHKKVLSINERLLRRLNRSWDGTLPMPARWWDGQGMAEFRTEVRELLASDFGESEPWGWKDPRTCLTLPLWQDVLDDMGRKLSYVIVTRNPLDIAASLERRDGFSLDKSLALYLLHTLCALHYTRGAQRVLVSYEAFLEDCRATMERVSAKLNLAQPDEEQLAEIERIVDASLSHGSSSSEAVEKVHYPAIRELDKLLREPDAIDSDTSVQTVARLLAEYESFAKLVGAQPTARQLNIAELFGIDGKEILREPRQARHLVDDGTMREYEFAVPWTQASALRFDPGSVPSVIEIGKIELWGCSPKQRTRRLLHSFRFDEIRTVQGLRPLTNGTTRCLMATNVDPILVLPLDPPPKDDALLSLKVTMAVHDVFAESTCQRLTQSFEEKDRDFGRLSQDTKDREHDLAEKLGQLEGSLRPPLEDITSISVQNTSALVRIQSQLEQLETSGASAWRDESGIAELQSELAAAIERMDIKRDEMLCLATRDSDVVAGIDGKLEALDARYSEIGEAIRAKLGALETSHCDGAKRAAGIDAKLDALNARHSENAEALQANLNVLETGHCEGAKETAGIGRKLDALGAEHSKNAEVAKAVRAKLDVLDARDSQSAKQIAGIGGKLNALGAEHSKSADVAKAVRAKLDVLDARDSQSAKQIAGIDTKLDALAGTYSGNAEAIKIIQSMLSALDTRHSESTKETAGIQAKIDTLGAIHCRNTDAIAGLQTALDSLQTTSSYNAGAAGQKLNDLCSALSRTETRLKTIESKLDGVGGAIVRQEDHPWKLLHPLRLLDRYVYQCWARCYSRLRRTARYPRFFGGRRHKKIGRLSDVIRNSGWFDDEFYLNSNPDVARSGTDPAVHFLSVGAMEGRKPHPDFDPTFYLLRNRDVATCGINPLVHYVLYGAAEGRSTVE